MLGSKYFNKFGFLVGFGPVFRGLPQGSCPRMPNFYPLGTRYPATARRSRG